MRFVFKMIVFPFWLLTAFLALMLKWTLNLSAFVLALPMRFECGESCPALARLQPDDSQPTYACQKDMPDQHPFSALQQLLTKDQEV